MNESRPERIDEQCLVRSLAEITRQLRRNELTQLRAENALMRFYQPHCLTTLAAAPDGPISVKKALKLIVDGRPMSKGEIQSEILRRFPNLASRSSGAFCHAVDELYEAGYFVRQRAEFGNSFVYTKKEAISDGIVCATRVQCEP